MWSLFVFFFFFKPCKALHLLNRPSLHLCCICYQYNFFFCVIFNNRKPAEKSYIFHPDKTESALTALCVLFHSLPWGLVLFCLFLLWGISNSFHLLTSKVDFKGCLCDPRVCGVCDMCVEARGHVYGVALLSTFQELTLGLRVAWQMFHQLSHLLGPWSILVDLVELIFSLCDCIIHK